MISGLNETPRSDRMHIGIFGRTNAGKSTVLNTLCEQEISVVSPVKGTTTDPVYKAMELLPIGPVVLIDTAGMDDDSGLGELRIAKTMDIMRKTDLCILVISGKTTELSYEKELLALFRKNRTPVVCVINEFEGDTLSDALAGELCVPYIRMDGASGCEIGALRESILQNADWDFEQPSITGRFVKKGDAVLLVAPQTIQAPKGRLILPQVQVMRDLLDNGCMVLTVQPDLLVPMLDNLRQPPSLVITDSQMFGEVNRVLPSEIPLTSFSVLMSGHKGDIASFVRGARAIDTLCPGDQVLIMEACTHHAMEGDIARQKLPDWLENHVGGKLTFEVFSGTGFPRNVKEYKLIVHCGGCMLNRKNMLSRIGQAMDEGVPITNFGIAIAHLNHILNRICY